MIRINMALLLIAVFCALGVVTAQHKARKLFQALEAEQERGRQLEVEFGQLQIELSTWATPPRIKKIARDKLKMHLPALMPAAAAHVAEQPLPATAGPVRGGRQ